MRAATQYVPSEHEEYMNSRQLQFFRTRLLKMRAEIDPDTKRFFSALKERRMQDADPLDQCSTMQNLTLDVSSRVMRCQTLSRIDSALERIETREYGYCEITGDEIGLRRLMAMPVATMCLEAQECHERLDARFRQPMRPSPYCAL